MTEIMENTICDRRQQQRHERQQQPQQSELIAPAPAAGPAALLRRSPRQDRQALAERQAACQSSHL